VDVLLLEASILVPGLFLFGAKTKPPPGVSDSRRRSDAVLQWVRGCSKGMVVQDD
jgi:hypothetical protein